MVALAGAAPSVAYILTNRQSPLVLDSVFHVMSDGRAGSFVGTTTGSVLANSPTLNIWQLAAAEVAASPLTEWDDKILVFPQSIDAGLVLAAKSYSTTVWSTRPYCTRLLSYTGVNLDGVDITNAEGYPVNFAPRQSRKYDINVRPSGGASIVGKIRWNFVGEMVEIAMTGTRLIAWTFEPDWSSAVEESLEWKTDIIKAYAGNEQRVRNRQNPRRSMKYALWIDGQQKLGTITSQLYGWAHRVFAVPVWTDQQRLGYAVAAGATTINVDTANKDFNPNQLAIIWQDAMHSEVVEIQTVNAGSVVLTKPVNSDWPAYARIVPCRLGRFSGELQTTYRTGLLNTATVTFAFEPKTAIGQNRVGTSPYTQLVEGLPVLTLAPEPDTDYPLIRDLTTVDFGMGPWSVTPRGGIPERSMELRWVLVDREKISAFFGWLDYCKGRLVPFWVPSWTRDIEVVAPIGASDLSITVRRNDFTKFVGQHDNRKYLAFIDANKTMIIKTVTSSSEAGENEVLTINSSFGSPKTDSSFACICWLYYCRLDSDSITLQWHDINTLECTIPVKEILK